MNPVYAVYDQMDDQWIMYNRTHAQCVKYLIDTYGSMEEALRFCVFYMRIVNP